MIKEYISRYRIPNITEQKDNDFPKKQAFLVTLHPPGDQLFYVHLRLMLLIFPSVIAGSKSPFLK